MNSKKVLEIKLSGGLGNQMFQYAMGKSLSVRYNAELKMDTSSFGKESEGVTTRKYALCIFPNLDGLSVMQSSVIPIFSVNFFNRIYRFLNKNIRFNKSYIIEKKNEYFEIPMNSDRLYLDGYWQSEKYFMSIREEIRKCFNLSHLEKDKDIMFYLEQVRTNESASIHIRRGDYVTNSKANSHHGVCGLTYYERAIEKIIKLTSESLTFFIFSDDIEWCKKNLPIKYNHVYVSTSKDYYDLYLMSKCSHNIIANSSFSWWAAWLNSSAQKKVIAPEKWFADTNAQDLIPEQWIKI